MALSWSSSLFNSPLNKSANPQVSHPMSTEAHQCVSAQGLPLYE